MDFRNSSDFNSHSQITIKRQPSSLRFLSVFLSRSMFRANFSCQNSTLVDGVVACRHPGWRCQKHPRTSMTVLYFGNTMSGCPGRVLTCSRKRKPCRNRNERTLSSGVVSFDRIWLIFQRRFSGDMRSIISVHPNMFEGHLPIEKVYYDQHVVIH